MKDADLLKHAAATIDALNLIQSRPDAHPLDPATFSWALSALSAIDRWLAATIESLPKANALAHRASIRGVLAAALPAARTRYENAQREIEEASRWLRDETSSVRDDGKGKGQEVSIEREMHVGGSNFRLGMDKSSVSDVNRDVNRDVADKGRHVDVDVKNLESKSIEDEHAGSRDQIEGDESQDDGDAGQVDDWDQVDDWVAMKGRRVIDEEENSSEMEGPEEDQLPEESASSGLPSANKQRRRRQVSQGQYFQQLAKSADRALLDLSSVLPLVASVFGDDLSVWEFCRRKTAPLLSDPETRLVVRFHVRCLRCTDAGRVCTGIGTICDMCMKQRRTCELPPNIDAAVVTPVVPKPGKRKRVEDTENVAPLAKHPTRSPSSASISTTTKRRSRRTLIGYANTTPSSQVSVPQTVVSQSSN